MVTNPTVGGRIETRRSLRWAGGLAALSLFLPWIPARSGESIPGWYAPGSCISVYDADGYATLDCSPGYFYPGWSTPGHSLLPGYATELRVLVLLAAGFLVIGLRRSSRSWQLTGLLIAVVALALNLSVQAGQLIFAAALVLATIALRQLWSTADTSPATSRIRSRSSAP